MNWKTITDQNRRNIKGITLIELLVAMVICAMVVAGIYRVFIAQSKAYTVQDQVLEVQQSVRSAMEILLRDLRVAGYDDYRVDSTVTITNPIVYPVSSSSITVNYEYYDSATAQYQQHTVHYWRDAASSTLMRQLTVDNVARPQEILLENVDAFELTYGLDADGDGGIDDRNGNNVIDEGDWVSSGVVGSTKVVAVRIDLTARPNQVNEDVQKTVSPRRLISSITLRNLCLDR
jgi:prepilin-type N-terminal cleavage/methylation domain-containing protein